MIEYYPGSEYVDWLGMSTYGKQFENEGWTTPAQAMDGPYKELAAVDTSKPIMISEWGVAEFPKSGNKAQYIHDAFERIASQYSRVKMAVFWHERWTNGDGTISDLHVNSSKGALEAYQKSIATPFWIDRPVLK